MKQLGTTTNGRIESMDPDKIFAFLYNNKSPTTLNKVMTILRQGQRFIKCFSNCSQR